MILRTDRPDRPQVYMPRRRDRAKRGLRGPFGKKEIAMMVPVVHR
jgi:hypothetical protein